MQSYRTDRVVRVLTILAAIAFYGLAALVALVLFGAPVVRVAAPDNPEWEWGLGVPVELLDTEVPVHSSWAGTRLTVEEARGSLRLPIALLPWWLFALLWIHLAVGAGLMLLFLHHLRRIFQRVRDGTPFDAVNAVRLRWLGMLLLALALFGGITETVASLMVRGRLSDGGIVVPAGLSLDGSLVLMAVILIALAEIFRRGAELEHEQSLVV